MLVLTSGCGAEYQLEAPAASGTVVDSRSLAPIHDALVTRINVSQDNRTLTRTDENGHFIFSGAKRLSVGC